MINKQLITRRFSRAIESYNREATAQKSDSRSPERYVGTLPAGTSAACA